MFDGASLPLESEGRWFFQIKGLEAALASPDQHAQKLEPIRKTPEVMGDVSFLT